MKIRLLCLLLCGLFPLLSNAQEKNGIAWPDNETVRMTSTMLGIGHRNLLDTYLSPEEYTGTEFRVLRENMRNTRLLDGRVSVQHLLQGNLAYLRTNSEEGKDLAGRFTWDVNWRYNWQLLPWLRLQAGPGWRTLCGFTYNMRNGNNPAQALLAGNLNISASAICRLHLLGRDIAVRYQADMPLLGVRFSPNYGQSYYEIFSLGHADHNVCLTHPFQAFTLNQLLTADIPLWGACIRLGYLCGIEQSVVNNLKQHDWSNLFIIGYVKQFQLIKY